MTDTIGMIRWQRDSEGVVTLVMDDPDNPVNTMNDLFIDSLEATNDRLEAERDSITGVILASAKRSWFAGGNLRELRTASRATADAETVRVNRMKRQFRRLETLGRPVVAAINGTTLGGGYEVALGCHHRIVSDNPRTKIGLPEVTLGMFPGAGGATRTVRMLGLERALTTVLLTGTQFGPREARAAGLVDEVVASDDELDAAAREWIAGHPDAAQPWDVAGFRIPGGAPSTAGVVPQLAASLPAYPARLREQLRGANYPAPRALLASAVEGAQLDIDSALALETRYFVSVIDSQVASNMIGANFFDLTEVTSGARRPAAPPKRTIETLGVIGGGMMGSGIAYTAARAGISVRVTDSDPAAGERVLNYARSRETERLTKQAARAGQSSSDERAIAEAVGRVLDRLSFTDDVNDLAGADLVVEAVAENLSVKQAVFATAERAAVLARTGGPANQPADAPQVLASNTSTLPIAEIASAVDHPQQVIGIHFFSPVDKMPLIEIVRAPQTSDETLALAFDFARQLRKTPIVVNDSRGFFTSRVIFRFIEEALAALDEGIPAASIEQAALQAGYATSPLKLVDELSLTLVSRIWRENAEATGAGGVWEPTAGASRVIERMLAEGRAGRASGSGLYTYETSGRRGLLQTHLNDAEPGRAPDQDAWADLGERMLFSEALEAVRCCDQGVIESLADANIGSLLGIGFPQWTGGVLRYIEQYEGGLAGFVTRAEQLSDFYGIRFAPPASLVEAAEHGKPLSSLLRGNASAG
ncbi:3-hydroxyacyl-CoA dehydrogenase NAD-binding domain-containing protein [Lysinibacter cavernae]|uniref:3-hydroxyacyl-CoA dehydrogenase/enoyl-CoA hydratase/3-hydroxybutyryl-CoA epimerase n=1 Tax=Lysinibacter cavernae TaxID=1640652 RepID=A0A7X5TSU0_9MICO|nr:3-hydroxyacyl-CoA dehydrogenase NAD-binding domain-containing protein [Lysinibacter cavernae]NIH53410.1 3-hydroxyacyl-CoA dehydrogenase/enoyl-CoA hydratase/3-hydroxybutyryl-CoA epimerase [Lysinibacter cavernae]